MRWSPRRLVLSGAAIAAALGAAAVLGVVVVTDDDTGLTDAAAAPWLPDDVGDGCGPASLTDTSDVSAGRALARCAPGAPAPDPPAGTARLRVAVTGGGEATAPVLVARELGEFAAEGLDVEIVDLPALEAYEAVVAGDVDAVAGPIGAPFFDAVAEGAGARWVLGGTVSRAPGDTAVPQAGLWYRTDRLSAPNRWDEVQGGRIGLSAGWRSATVYPVASVTEAGNLTLNEVDLVRVAGGDAAQRLLDGTVAAAWVDQPAWARLADTEGIELAGTLPGSETIEGTVVSGRLLDADRDVGVAFARAVIRTVNTHLTGDYRRDDEVMGALTDATGSGRDALTATPALLFDWEIREGTTERLQEAMVDIGSVGYEQPLPEDRLVDRTLALDALGPRAR